MSIIRFTDKEKWLVCDADGTKKVIRTFPKREGGKWVGRGVTTISPDQAEKMNVTWMDEPIKVIEHKAWEINDFKF